jgi:hypothetical protein
MPRTPLTVLPLGLLLMLGGCAGFGDFLYDTHTFANKNRPVGDSENIRRVTQRQSDVDPLLPEPGNIWPTEQVADPTLLSVMQAHPETEQSMQGIQQQEQQRLKYNSSQPPQGPAPTRENRGSSTPPPEGVPGLTPLPNTEYRAPPVSSAPSGGGIGPSTVQTPQGTGVITGGGSGFQTTTSPRPGGGNAIIVPNGNGTSTVINPDGSIQTIPTPK